MNTIAYTCFNEKPEYYMNEIFNNKEDAVILKNGTPFLKIFPVVDKIKINPLKNSIIYETDIISPIDVDWEANQ